jgi:hypothetical protein
MKNKRASHFPWNNDPKSATEDAECLAEQLRACNVDDVHVWRDPAGRRTTVEWTEER